VASHFAHPNPLPPTQAAHAKAALLCLSQLLAALDPSAWLSAVPAFNQLLAFSMDARPKVRKRAAQGLVEVFAGLQHSPALGQASDLLAKGAWQILGGYCVPTCDVQSVGIVSVGLGW
jgi:hypothetical protein